MSKIFGRAAFAASALLVIVPAMANAADFYAGKTVTIVTSTGAGGTYDIAARTIARNMPRHLHITPKDGTTIATVNQSVPAHQVLDGRGVRYDADKFNWLGALGDRNQVFVVWQTTGIKTFDDLKSKGVTAGSTGEGSSGFRYPTAINNVLGTNIKIVKGYKAAGDVELAMLRGEVSAQAHSYTAFSTGHPDWIKEGKIVFIMQIGYKRDKDLPNVPLWSELAQTKEQKDVLDLIAAPIPLGRPFLAPPGLPTERVAELRKAFAATLADPQFVEDARKQDLDVVPMTGEEIAEIVKHTIDTSPDIVAKAKAAMGGNME